MTRIIGSGGEPIVPSVVLGANINFFKWKDLQRGVGWAQVNNAYPAPLSLCRTPPLLRITQW